MKPHINRDLQVGFGLSLLLVVISSVASFLAINNLLNTAAKVDQSNLVISKLESIISTMKDAETGQRGYLLSGREDFLQPYNGSEQIVFSTVKEVSGLSGGDPFLQDHVNQLKSVLTLRFISLQQLIDAKRSGKTISIGQLQKGKAEMDDLRSVVNQMENQEKSVLAQTSANQRLLTAFTPVIIMVTVLLSLLISLRYYFKLRQKYQENINLRRDLEEKEKVMGIRLNEELRVQQEELEQSNQMLEERSHLLEVRNQIILERNQEIQRKAEELELATQYKSEFMANMSHELRTPLNSILLLSRHLAENNEENLTAEQVESAQVILNAGNGLLNLIDEILDLSKIEAGKMEAEYERVTIGEILLEMQALFAPVAREKKLNLVIAASPDLEDAIETDKPKLEQILKNLLSNALKFTAQGEVSLKAEAGDRPGFIRFAVKDSGIGISKKDQELIFEPFRQADGPTRRNYGGTGLGLSISKKLAELLQGEIKLNSEPGKGSEFVLSVPKEKLATEIVEETAPARQKTADQKVSIKEASAPVADRIKHLTTLVPAEIKDDRDHLKDNDKLILIVEDDTVFANALLKFTREKGYKGLVAVRGDQGLEMAHQYKPNAILLDIQLPVKDGWEVMEELKNGPETRHIPVHIMSSLEVKKESLLKGAIDFINKPLAVDQMKTLFEKLEDAMRRSPKKVLIVEDNGRHAKALSYFLETFNIGTEISGNINQSINTLQKREVDCVIMDMGVSGKAIYESLETITKQPDLNRIPIIVFTGKNLSTAEESRIMRFADSIVIKTAQSCQRVLDEVALFLHVMEGKEASPASNGVLSKKPGALTEVLKSKTILIADDDVRNIFSLTKSFEKYKMNVVTATNGREALGQLQQQHVDIVLMDMMMPEMDGYETIGEIRQQPNFKQLPIIAVTAKVMPADREACIRAGASDYVSKPVDVDQLISLLRVWLYGQVL